MTDEQALQRARAFATGAPVVSAARYGSGHVNDTFKVTDRAGRQYVLQRINTTAFHHPEQVMDNIVRVTKAVAEQVADPRRRLALVPALDGSWWIGDGQQCWRMYDFIDGSGELESPLGEDELFLAGRAFGEFMVQVAVIPAEQLHVTIEAYHDEPRYIARLKAAVAADALGRAGAVRDEISRALAFEGISHDFDGTDMPLRVTHNDAKVSNVLFDAATRQPLCVVDLDTVQPGYAVNDFGDAIRSGATTAPEDEADLARVRFDIGLFAAFTRGYLEACGAVLLPSEIKNLRQGARLMTLETTLRFLTDYIEGDVYYHIDREGQNLDRARNQLTLLEDIQRNWDAMGRVLETIQSGM